MSGNRRSVDLMELQLDIESREFSLETEMDFSTAVLQMGIHLGKQSVGA